MLDNRVRAVLERLEREDAGERAQGLPPVERNLVYRAVPDRAAVRRRLGQQRRRSSARRLRRRRKNGCRGVPSIGRDLRQLMIGPENRIDSRLVRPRDLVIGAIEALCSRAGAIGRSATCVAVVNVRLIRVAPIAGLIRIGPIARIGLSRFSRSLCRGLSRSLNSLARRLGRGLGRSGRGGDRGDRQRQNPRETQPKQCSHNAPHNRIIGRGNRVARIAPHRYFVHYFRPLKSESKALNHYKVARLAKSLPPQGPYRDCRFCAFAACRKARRR